MGSEGQILSAVANSYVFFAVSDNLSYLKAWILYFRFTESYSFILKALKIDTVLGSLKTDSVLGSNSGFYF